MNARNIDNRAVHAGNPADQQDRDVRRNMKYERDTAVAQMVLGACLASVKAAAHMLSAPATAPASGSLQLVIGSLPFGNHCIPELAGACMLGVHWFFRHMPAMAI